MTRSFVALTLPDPALDLIERFQDEIPVGRLMTRDTLHLTLAFLDAQPAGVLEEIHYGLEQITAQAVPLQITGAEVFGSNRRQAIALSVAPNPALSALHQDIARAVRAAGVTRERRRFRPHITVARLNGTAVQAEAPRVAQFLEAAGGFRPEPVTVTQFALYSSQLTPEGAVHNVLASYNCMTLGPDA